MPVFRRLMYYMGQVARETGQALDRAGCFLQGNYAYREALFASRHRQIMNLVDKKPIVPPSVKFIAPNATVIGDVRLGADCSIWYGAVLRGDVNKIIVGERSNIQDRAVVHVASGGGDESKAAPTWIGDDVTIGHAAIVHACVIEEHAVVGMGAVLLDKCRIEPGAVVAAGATVTPGTVVGANQIWVGSPARFLRAVTDEERQQFAHQCQAYVRLAALHAEECGKTPAQLEAERVAQQLREERSDDYMSSLGLLGRDEEIIAGQMAYLERERRLVSGKM